MFFNLFRRRTSMERRIEVVPGPSDTWHWRMVHRNGEILAHSENYSSKAKAVQTATGVAVDGRFPLEIE